MLTHSSTVRFLLNRQRSKSYKVLDKHSDTAHTAEYLSPRASGVRKSLVRDALTFPLAMKREALQRYSLPQENVLPIYVANICSGLEQCGRR